MSVYRSSSEKSRKFWAGVDKSAAEVADWPDWKIDRPRTYASDEANSGTKVDADCEVAR